MAMRQRPGELRGGKQLGQVREQGRRRARPDEITRAQTGGGRGGKIKETNFRKKKPRRQPGTPKKRKNRVVVTGWDFKLQKVKLPQSRWGKPFQD